MKTKKSAKKRVVAKRVKKEKVIGKAEHYYDKINVITTTLKAPLKVGDMVHIKGHTTDFIQPVESIQIEHEMVQKAKKGAGVGIKVTQFVRDHDIIYLAGKKTALAKTAAKPVSSVELPKINPITVKVSPPETPDSQKYFRF